MFMVFLASESCNVTESICFAITVSALIYAGMPLKEERA